LNTNLTTGTGSTDNGAILRRAGFPENYIVTAPQYSAANIAGNESNSTYHAFHLQLTRRLTSGFTSTNTFIWSKSLSKGDDIDPSHRGIEKALQDADRKYQFQSNGTFALPFGQGHRLWDSAPGWANYVVNGWQLGGILNLTSGGPLSFTTGIQTISYNAGANSGAKPNLVGNFPGDIGKVSKVANGVAYFEGYTQPLDTSFTPTTLQNMASAYTNRALVAPNGQVVLVNPRPGERGTLAYTTHRGPGEIRFDMNLVKRFRLHERKEFEFRLDAINILNHPNFGDPATNINNINTFGRITTATGSRRFVTNLRLNF
jgi:hypothetical protein